MTEFMWTLKRSNVSYFLFLYNRYSWLLSMTFS